MVEGTKFYGTIEGKAVEIATVVMEDKTERIKK